MKVGDLVFYDLDTTGERNPSHVGIFVGYLPNGEPMIIDASSHKVFGEVVLRSIGLNGNAKNLTDGSYNVTDASTSYKNISMVKRYIDESGNIIT